MTKITIHADCAEVPQKALLRDLNIAFRDVCQFESAAGNRVKSMKSYAVELKAKSS